MRNNMNHECFCMGQKLRTRVHGLGLYLKQLICNRWIFRPTVEFEQNFNVENWKSNNTNQIYIRCDNFLFIMPSLECPRNVCSKMGLQDKALLNNTKSLSLSLSLSQIKSLHIGDLFLFYNTSASILNIHL